MHGLKYNTNGKALIVEDDDHMRALLSSMVRELGFAGVLEAASIDGALALLDTNAVTIALVDLCLADEDGVDLIQAIRGHSAPQVHRSPIVVVSRAATETRVLAALNAGADGFVAKPLSTATFHRQVSLAFVKRSLTKPEALGRQRELATPGAGAPANVVELD